MATKLARIDTSTLKDTARQVLEAEVDRTGTRWRRCVFSHLKTVKQWASAAASSASGYPHRGASEMMKKIENFKFPADLRSSDPSAQSACWNSTRAVLINALRDTLTTGCDFEQVLTRLLTASNHQSTGNVRVAGYVKEILDDTLFEIFPPLAADILIFKLDITYHDHVYGSDSIEADWDRCTKRTADDDSVSLATRCLTAYLQKIAHTHDANSVWGDPSHANTLNQRIADCLLNDVADAARVAKSYAVFLEQWRYFQAMYEIKEAPATHFSGVRICRLYVATKESVTPATIPSGRGGRGRGLGAAAAAAAAVPAGTADPAAVLDTVASAQPAPLPPKGKGAPSKGKGGKPSSQPTGRGAGAASAAPGAQPPPAITNDHRSEPPPPNRGGAAAHPTSLNRLCDPPAGDVAKPPGMVGGDWTTPQWRQVLIDFDAVGTLAPTAAGVATAKFRPAAKWNSGGQPETTLGRPVSALLSDGTYSWGPNACAYCAFREPAPAGTATADQWWFGTGDGAHNPYRCQPAKRYLAEGGDAAVDPAYAPHLRRCLRVAPNRG